MTGLLCMLYEWTKLNLYFLFFCPSLQSCQADLVKDNGHKYFLSVLADSYMPVSIHQPCFVKIIQIFFKRMHAFLSLDYDA